MRTLSIGVICLLLALTSSFSSAAEWGPWSSGSSNPVIGPGTSPPTLGETADKSPAASLLTGLVRFFQKNISPIDGDRCSMAPTCSHFSVEAIQKHGALLGFVMTADRIVHEYEEQRFVPLVWDGSSSRFYDPVSNNDFWFAPSPARAPIPSTTDGE